MDKVMERILRRAYKQEVPRETKPLIDEPRYYCSEDDYEMYTEYGFLHSRGLSDEEVNEIIDDMWIEIRSPWDCTGQLFTKSIHWHRNPSGLISYIHRMGIDV